MIFDILPEEVKARVLQVLKNLEHVVDSISSRSLRDAVYTYITRPGKLIRPTLCILTTYLLDGDLSRSVDAATAVECIHIASLLQDDIIDRHDVRRGIITPYARLGPELSMLASNILIARAIEYSLRTGIPDIQRELIRAALALTDGAALEIEAERDERELRLQDYMKIIIRKTASLIEAAMVLGALIANADRELVFKVKMIGRLLGITYQLRDDLLDYLRLDRQNPGRGDKLNIVYILERSGYSRHTALELTCSLIRKLGDSALRSIRKVFGSRSTLLVQLVRNIVCSTYNMQFT